MAANYPPTQICSTISRRLWRKYATISSAPDIQPAAATPPGISVIYRRPTSKCHRLQKITDGDCGPRYDDKLPEYGRLISVIVRCRDKLK